MRQLVRVVRICCPTQSDPRLAGRNPLVCIFFWVADLYGVGWDREARELSTRNGK